MWDSAAKEMLDKFDLSVENESSVTDVLWISSGRFAASMSSGNIHIRRIESPESLQTFIHSVTSQLSLMNENRNSSEIWQEFPHSLGWCAEDRLLAACFYDGFIKVRFFIQIELKWMATLQLWVDVESGSIGRDHSFVALSTTHSLLSLVQWPFEEQGSLHRCQVCKFE